MEKLNKKLPIYFGIALIFVISILLLYQFDIGRIFLSIFFLLIALLVLIWIYKLIFGKPFNFNHAVDRAMLSMIRHDPELFTMAGIIDNTILDFHSGKLTDASPDIEKLLMEKTKKSLNLIHSYNRNKLSVQKKVTYDIIEWYLEQNISYEKFPYHCYSFNPVFMTPYPINQLGGPHQNILDLLATFQKVTGKKSAKRYISRLSFIQQKFYQTLKSLEHRENQKIIPPKFIIQKVIIQMKDFISKSPIENVLYISFKDKIEKSNKIKPQARIILYNQVEEIIQTIVYPAYEKLIKYFEKLEKISTTIDGVWRFPNGLDYYATLLRSQTTTDLTPDQIHETGLKEVSRIHKEMKQILTEQGYEDNNVINSIKKLMKEERFTYPDSDESRQLILKDFKNIVDDINANIGKMFDFPPITNFEVKRMAEFKEKNSPGAFAQPPSLDGRPGVFWVNLRSPKDVFKFGMRTLAYHEAIPGHVFQMSIAQKLKGIPFFRRIFGFSAYVEGWALYAEKLTSEHGFHEDPFSNVGRLQAELFRAVRLVVDTGIHAKKWTREEAIDYMLDNTGLPEIDVIAEIERYIAAPGQSCCYKIGMIKMVELREKVISNLKDSFDLKDYHNLILKNGTMPLAILDRIVKKYIEDKKSV
ncbi:MAG: DUF885 domain-containing protein [archaeon]|nr:DUF885 domain-containing protein [archaeon]